MTHLILLGDSVLDNGAYTGGGPDVLAQVRQRLPQGWRASLAAVDGSMAEDIHEQLRSLPADATHLLLSVGGNDALMRSDLLDTPVGSSAEALSLLHEAARGFEARYRLAVEACLRPGLPLVVCTVYHGNFPEPAYRQRVGVALTVFNDVIVRLAIEKQLRVIDLRFVCDSPADYANPIEPSCIGGEKIASAIVRAVTGVGHAGPGAHLVAF